MIRQPRWSCRFSPTPGSSCTMSMPCSFNSAAAPTPDNCNSCGDNSEPPAEQYLAAGADPADSAVLRVFEADRALAVEQHAMGEGAGLAPPILPLPRRPREGS